MTVCLPRYCDSFISSYMITLWGFLAGTFFSPISFISSSPAIIPQDSITGRRRVHGGHVFINPSTMATLFRLHCTISVFISECTGPATCFSSVHPLPPRFVNLIKAAIKQCFICLGPNLPSRRHVTTYAAHTCRVCSSPDCRLSTQLTLPQPVPGTSTHSMSPMAGMHANIVGTSNIYIYMAWWSVLCKGRKCASLVISSSLTFKMTSTLKTGLKSFSMFLFH